MIVSAADEAIRVMSGTPKLKSLDIFNSLSRVQMEDVEIARVFSQDLAALNKSHPGDFVTKVAFAEALLLSGNRQAAIDQMLGAFSLRDRSAYAVMDRLALLFMFVANREKSVQLVEEYAFQAGLHAGDVGDGNQTIIASWAADIELLERLVERDRQNDVPSSAKLVLESLIEMKTIDRFRRYQHTLIEAVRDVQVSVCFLAADDDQGPLVFVNNIFFDGTRTTRRDLESKAFELLNKSVGNSMDHVIQTIFTAAPRPDFNGLKVIDGGAQIGNVTSLS